MHRLPSSGREKIVGIHAYVSQIFTIVNKQDSHAARAKVENYMRIVGWDRSALRLQVSNCALRMRLATFLALCQVFGVSKESIKIEHECSGRSGNPHLES